MTSWKSWKHRICAALLLGAVSMHAAIAAPVLSATASATPAIVNSTLGVDVSIANVSDLYGYQFTLLFDPALLQATGAATEGPFLATGGSTFFDGGTVDNALDSISFVFDTMTGPVPGVNGSGALAHFSFNVMGSGTSDLSFADVLFIDTSFNDLGVQARNLAVTAVPEPSAYLLLAIGLAGLTAARRRTIQ